MKLVHRFIIDGHQKPQADDYTIMVTLPAFNFVVVRPPYCVSRIIKDSTSAGI